MTTNFAPPGPTLICEWEKTFPPMPSTPPPPMPLTVTWSPSDARDPRVRIAFAGLLLLFTTTWTSLPGSGLHEINAEVPAAGKLSRARLDEFAGWKQFAPSARKPYVLFRIALIATCAAPSAVDAVDAWVRRPTVARTLVLSNDRTADVTTATTVMSMSAKI